MMIGHDGLTTNVLKVPLAPLGYLAALSCVVSAVIAISRLYWCADSTRTQTDTEQNR